jgi:site-specific DNA recombinase
VQLLNEPELVRAEIERRIQESQSSDPVQQRKLRLERELKRIASQLDKLLDAYQEDLIGLGDLRSRAPELRRRQAAIEKELEGVALQALEKSRLTQLNASMENFLAALRQSAKKLEVVERQKVVRLVIKQIVVNGDALTIQHSIPISRSNEDQPRASYALCTRGNYRPLRCPLLGRLPSLNAVHHPCPKHLFYELQYSSVSDFLPDAFHQPLLRDAVKVALQIRIDYPVISAL